MPGFARGYSPLQLGIAGMLAVAVVLGGLWMLRMVTAPTYAVLYSNLSEADAGAIVEQLGTEGVPYELAAGGTAIMVPAAQVDDLRISLASSGLPDSSVVGYELLDGQSLTTSSFREQVNYQRALEGELSQTLMSMDGVENAQVRLVLPEERLFSNETRPASASVQLTTARTLTDDQVQAVVHLVAAAVPDLAPGNVTVTDSTGQLLAGGPDGTAGAADKLQAETEARLTAAADTMLTSVLGPNASVVRVAAVISRDNQVQQSEVFDPTRQAVGSSTTSTESYNSTSSQTAGGTLTANPDPVAAATAADQTDASTVYTSEASAAENLVSRTVTERTTPPGTVSRLTVAVAVDEASGANPEQIQQLVAGAVGLDVARGDTIVVSLVPFNKPAEPEAATPAEEAAAGMLPTILGGALLVLIAGFLLWRLRPRRTAIDPAELAAASGETAVAPAPDRPTRSNAERLLDQVDASPAEAAGVIRGWLAEDQTAKSR
jgi:flagellar M-ring protein FliF